MNYRVVGAEHMQQVAELWDYCFEKKTEPFFKYYFEEYCGKENTVIGGFEDCCGQEKLRTMLHVNPYTLRLRTSELAVPYLVGIATAPEARGQHLLRPLLQTAFEVLRSQGFTFVTLMPVNAGIYLPYDFAYCYYRHEYKMPMAALAPTAAGSELAAERVQLADVLAGVMQQVAEDGPQSELAAVYDAVTAPCSGVPVRTAFQWRKLLGVMTAENVQCVLVYRDGTAAGYMLYSISDGSFTAHELLAVDFAAKNRLLQFACGHKSEAQEFCWLAGEWDKTYLGFRNQEQSGSLKPFMMARCLDARKALAQLPVPRKLPDSSVVLLVTDKVIESNNHLLKLQTAPGSLEAVSTSEQEEVTMDMGAFTQLYFGAFTATELWEAGRIKCSNLQKLQLLDALFTKQRTYNNEYF